MAYIKIDRKIEKWEWFDNPTMFYFWVRLLLMANYEERKWHTENVERGSIITTISKLSTELKLSVQKVRNCLSHLENNKQITLQTTNKRTKITICKYDSYQDITTNKQQTENTPNSDKSTHQPTNALLNTTSIITIDNKEKKEKKKKISNDIYKDLVFPYSSNEFLSTWNILVEQPRWKKKTQHAYQLNLDDLAKYPEAFAILLMEESIKHGWQGIVFENTPSKYQSWLKDNPQKEVVETNEEYWKQDHHLYGKDDFDKYDPYEFTQLLPEMQKDLMQGKKMLVRNGLWEWPEDYPDYEIFN